jgi:hypothetical protein
MNLSFGGSSLGRRRRRIRKRGIEAPMKPRIVSARLKRRLRINISAPRDALMKLRGFQLCAVRQIPKLR